MMPCKVRQGTPQELAEADKLPKPKKIEHYDRSPVFRRKDKNHMKVAGSGWQAK